MLRTQARLLSPVDAAPRAALRAFLHRTTAACRASARNRLGPSFNTPRALARRALSESHTVEARLRRGFPSVGMTRLALRRVSRTGPSASNTSRHPNTASNGPNDTFPSALAGIGPNSFAV